ncbi:Ca2+:H+ antiporter [Rhodoblastus acidophilus]|uniref:Ca2+:H+ antiporter n=1 Tax=Rhodoblastus acidophilus TaxID=1074 RepID=A0A212RBC4_RHOAC|nr:calcium:proton antiporter [Rhodoblastus acidophilus]PPQ39386.1 calcium:proton antiporter [Rhodoblastus acidophilus]RAI19406.1 calcium:proton antiporter [Rhodoblastus acidophilus]SNB69507.1 Ca2+:H+ antiporter [Rhodoblastus acidophilus]
MSISEAAPHAPPPTNLRATLRRESVLAIPVATCAAFLSFGPLILSDLSQPAKLGFVFLWLFGVILVSSLGVVRHAEHLAQLMGEPYGTLILTLAVTAIEVMSISAIMLHGANNPTLVRDTLLSVIMIVLNGMVGLSLLLGALRRREQHYNLQGANAYLGVIIPLAVLTLIMPNYTTTTAGPTLSNAQEHFLSLMAAALYATFLTAQTGRHRGYFTGPDQEERHGKVAPTGSRSIAFHAAMLGAFMLPVVYLAEQLAHPVDYLIETMGAPSTLGGVTIAALVATPEAIGATAAAVRNQMQRSINIFLGSVLSTIGLTVPAMLVVSHWTGRTMVLGVEHADFVMLLLTLGVSIVTFASGRTNILQGIVHLLLFLAFVLLIFQG